MCAPDFIRTKVDVLAALGVEMMKVTSGIKQSFDPDGIFNPGRMYAGV
jgi:glycolate oxidase FAD binding subunit